MKTCCTTCLIVALWLFPLTSVAFPPYTGHLAWDDILINDMTLDDTGNVYIAGRAFDPNNEDGNNDIGIAKYNTKGNLSWKRCVDGPQQGFDYGNGISLDEDGNIYVVGSVQLTSRRQGTFDRGYYLLKYSSGGKLLWRGSYKDVQTSVDDALLAIGPKSECCLLGSRERGGRNGGFITIKYDSNGRHAWTAHYSGSADSLDMPSDIVIDRKGCIYVTGSSTGSDDDYDFATVKYDPHGKQLWAVRVGGEPNKKYSPRALALDSSGNLHVAGSYTDRQDRTRTIIIKYDPDGRTLWQRSYKRKEADTHPRDILVSKSGGVYITCYAEKRLVVLKYSADGVKQWPVSHKMNLLHSYSGPCQTILDTDGNLFVSAFEWAKSSSWSEPVLMKINSQGAWSWVKSFKSASEFIELCSRDE